MIRLVRRLPALFVLASLAACTPPALQAAAAPLPPALPAADAPVADDSGADDSGAARLGAARSGAARPGLDDPRPVESVTGVADGADSATASFVVVAAADRADAGTDGDADGDADAYGNADADRNDEVSAEASLSARLEGLLRFHASFDQRLYDGRGMVLRRTRGELWAQRPDRFRWEVSAPFAEVLVGDGSMLWLWDPDLEQVTVRPYDDRLKGTPALLLSGRASELVESFVVDRIRDDGEDAVYQLTPRSEDSLFERLEMSFAGNLPRALVIHDGLGQRTEVRFEAAETTFPDDPERFSFEIPDGVDVLRETAESAADGGEGG
ncbi:MAG TPA: outer membrane lipoprotein chaperone LolA [Pseudomonadales bacterium]|nr:outer membrane lipoprotein chaperone LolA [Pseudomonadales bacterium]